MGEEIAAREDVTAVFCANDQMALGLLRRSQRGRPRRARRSADVSVVGFDDIPEAAYLIPPLTTVRQDFRPSAAARSRSFSAALRRPPNPTDSSAPELVVRASSAAPVERKP